MNIPFFKTTFMILMILVLTYPEMVYAQQNEDPDLPALPNRSLSKEEYLLRREQHISNLRGNQFINENTYNARKLAIEQKTNQERLQ